MATFTVNSGRKITQAALPPKIFDKAFLFSLFLVVVVGGAYGIQKFLIFSLQKETARYTEEATTKLSAVSQEQVTKVQDISTRMLAIQKNTKTGRDSQEVLAALERSTMPQSKVGEFTYNKDGSMSFSGSAGDYRLLAEQMIRYQQEKVFAGAKVTGSDRSEDGRIGFSVNVPAGQGGVK
jgi:hypothetical protein